jgi:hypothetical protein
VICYSDALDPKLRSQKLQSHSQRKRAKPLTEQAKSGNRTKSLVHRSTNWAAHLWARLVLLCASANI